MSRMKAAVRAVTDYYKVSCIRLSHFFKMGTALRARSRMLYMFLTASIPKLTHPIFAAHFYSHNKSIQSRLYNPRC
jgi:hypothetical protein